MKAMTRKQSLKMIKKGKGIPTEYVKIIKKN